jgi:PTH1 family peptidyl-tRNA hydrolase
MVDEAPILVVAGLGNPGLRYARTWHNLGYMALDFWAESKNLTFKPGRGDYTYLDYRTSKGVITFLKPTSYMNLSGHPVGHMTRYRKYQPDNVLIVCDDVALPLGVLRIRKAGSSGGHKGLDSVIAELGSESVSRLRIGVFTEGWRGELSDYVLARIPEQLQKPLRNILAGCVEAIDCIIHEGVTPAMNRFNRNLLQTDAESDIDIDGDR